MKHKKPETYNTFKEQKEILNEALNKVKEVYFDLKANIDEITSEEKDFMKKLEETGYQIKENQARHLIDEFQRKYENTISKALDSSRTEDLGGIGKIVVDINGTHLN